MNVSQSFAFSFLVCHYYFTTAVCNLIVCQDIVKTSWHKFRYSELQRWPDTKIDTKSLKFDTAILWFSTLSDSSCIQGHMVMIIKWNSQDMKQIISVSPLILKTCCTLMRGEDVHTWRQKSRSPDFCYKMTSENLLNISQAHGDLIPLTMHVQTQTWNIWMSTKEAHGRKIWSQTCFQTSFFHLSYKIYMFRHIYRTICNALK